MAQFLTRTQRMIVLVFTLMVTVLAEGDEERLTPSPSTSATTTELFECHGHIKKLQDEKQKLRNELDAIKARMEAAALEDMEEEEDESNESHSRSRGIRAGRGKRGTAGCEGGTVAQWACGPQCIYKLKGLCGLSLRAMCHC